jgi:hypothetical protein
MFVTKKEQPNRAGHRLKRTAQRKFDILKFGQLSAQLKKGEGEEKNCLHIGKGYPSLFPSPTILRNRNLYFKS